MNKDIQTSAEALEADAIPRVHDVHSDPDALSTAQSIPNGLKRPVARKSAAQWAYERLIIYIRNFEKTLDNEHEIAMGFAGGEAGVLRIEGMGFYDPDIVTFYGTDAGGAKTQLVQHVSQLNVLLRALPKNTDQEAPNRIGFRLAADLQETEDATG
jgi:hypothetical protein